METGVGRTDVLGREAFRVFLTSVDIGPYIVTMSGILLMESHCLKASWLSCLPSASLIKFNFCISSASCFACFCCSSFSTKCFCLSKYHWWLAKILAHCLCPHARAKVIGVCPLLSTALIIPPAFISSCKHFTFPSFAALCTGVIPELVDLLSIMQTAHQFSDKQKLFYE